MKVYELTNGDVFTICDDSNQTKYKFIQMDGAYAQVAKVGSDDPAYGLHRYTHLIFCNAQVKKVS